MLELAGEPGILGGYALALHQKAAAVRDLRQNLSDVQQGLGRVMDDGWEQALTAWIDRTCAELGNVANHFDAASTVYRQLATSVQQANEQMNKMGVVAPLSANALGTTQSNLFDSTTIARNQAAGHLQSLANEAPQIVTAQAMQPRISSQTLLSTGAEVGLVLLGIGALILTEGADSEVLGSDGEQTVPIAEQQLAAEEAEQAAWNRYLVRKASEGIDPLSREAWTSKYQTVIANRAAGTAFEQAVLDSLGEAPAGGAWQTQVRESLPGGARILDVADPEAKIAYEAKSGNAINGSDILNQLSKDAQLLKSDWVITWVSESEPQGAVLGRLEQMKLLYPNFDYIVVGK